MGTKKGIGGICDGFREATDGGGLGTDSTKRLAKMEAPLKINKCEPKTPSFFQDAIVVSRLPGVYAAWKGAAIATACRAAPSWCPDDSGRALKGWNTEPYLHPVQMTRSCTST